MFTALMFLVDEIGKKFLTLNIPTVEKCKLGLLSSTPIYSLSLFIVLYINLRITGKSWTSLHYPMIWRTGSIISLLK
jgi:hypothetical protein